MTLKVDLRQCKESKIKKTVDTYQLGILAWGIGMPTITEDNYQEFYLRLRLFLFMCNTKQFLTLNQVKQLIGLWTNVTYMTSSKFLNHNFKHSMINLKQANRIVEEVA